MSIGSILLIISQIFRLFFDFIQNSLLHVTYYLLKLYSAKYFINFLCNFILCIKICKYMYYSFVYCGSLVSYTLDTEKLQFSMHIHSSSAQFLYSSHRLHFSRNSNTENMLSM